MEPKKISPRGSLISKNITILGRRTSVRLEAEMWKSLQEISQFEKCTIHNLCSLIAIRKSELASLTSAIRLFLMMYYKAAATAEGHKSAGHGSFDKMQLRAKVRLDHASSSEWYERLGKKVCNEMRANG